MMKTLYRSLTGAIANPAMITSRMFSTWVWVAASISRTSMSRPSAISTHASHVPHGSGVGPCSQLRARARMRAVVVFPDATRGPAKMKACASRSLVIALRSVWVTPRWPTTPWNVCGRYFPGENLIGHHLVIPPPSEPSVVGAEARFRRVSDVRKAGGGSPPRPGRACGTYQ